MNAKAVVVIGAGPYGLSVAAHLRGRGIPAQVFGDPMAFWRRMPAGMFLKSPWTASSLSDPSAAFSLDRYVEAGLAPRTEPIPLPYFLNYTQWFQRNLVEEIDSTVVQSLSLDGTDFRLGLSDGRTLEAGRVVVAIGIQPFTHIPDFAHDLPPELASHSLAHSDFSRFRGRSVAVVGAGQSGLECAALLHEAGVQVELITRRQIIWISRTLYEHAGPAKYLFYPPTDVGPPGLNWLIAFPLIVRYLPEKMRLSLRRRAMRPAGAKWLRARVDGQIKTTPDTAVRRATTEGGQVRLELSDGSVRVVDHLLLGTGFRPDLQRIPFLDDALRVRVAARHGFPNLNEWFESSIPGLHFVGGVAGYDFGPLCNFVAGTKLTARQVARRAAAAA
jgi:cation diffusion facilitator CzcD-associated flavoprotein CzcO